MLKPRGGGVGDWHAPQFMAARGIEDHIVRNDRNDGRRCATDVASHLCDDDPGPRRQPQHVWLRGWQERAPRRLAGEAGERAQFVWHAVARRKPYDEVADNARLDERCLPKRLHQAPGGAYARQFCRWGWVRRRFMRGRRDMRVNSAVVADTRPAAASREAHEYGQYRGDSTTAPARQWLVAFKTQSGLIVVPGAGRPRRSLQLTRR